VLPSGTFPSWVVTVSKGGDLQPNILMQSSALQVRNWFEPNTDRKRH